MNPSLKPQRRGDRNPFSEAVGHLNDGAPAQAVAYLRQVLALSPGHPVALTLMGIALVEQGDPAGAEIHLQRALSISPGRPEILYHLARAVRLAGRPLEAASLCRSALARAPENGDVSTELAAACMESGAFEDALDLYRSLVVRHPRSIDTRRALAACLLEMERPAEAEQGLRQALALAPTGDDTDAVAAAHCDLGDILRTRRAFEEALVHYAAAGSDGAAIRRHKGRAAAFQHLGRFDEAVEALTMAVAGDPLDMDAHLQLNELLYRQERDQGFLQSYDEAASRFPRSAAPFLAKGRLLLKLGKPAPAKDCFDHALKRSPGDPGALIGHARALEALGEVAEAGAVYEGVLRTGTAGPDTLVDASSFFLRRDMPDRAFRLAEQALAANPFSQEALALLTLCYRALGDEQEFELAGYDSLVRVFDLAPPSGFADMAEFNRELAAYLASLHSDAREHFTQTLHGGTRLYGAIFRNGHKLADRLQPGIDRAIADYVRNLPAAAPRAFRDRRTNGFRYAASWSSRLAAHGFHSNHIHPEGWISCVYYVAVPALCGNATTHEGWLKFGEPTPDFGRRYSPRRFVEPKPGRLVLFPSYLWHGTIPLTISHSRMTIAFDVAPRGLRGNRSTVPVSR